MRLLSRLQFAVANRGKPWVPGTADHPQGQLFPAWHYNDLRSRPDPDVKEAGRRRMAGENNPDAPWKTPFLQHHFLPTHDRRTGRPLSPPSVEQRFFE